MTTTVARRLVALALLALVFVVLALAGSAVDPPHALLAGPWDAFDPLLTTAAVLRAGAMAACGWLALITLLDLLALAMRLHPLHRLVTRLAPRAWRSLVLRPVAVAALAIPQVVVPVASIAPAAAEAAAVAPDDVHRVPAAVLEMRRHSEGERIITMSVHAPVPGTPSPAPDQGSTSHEPGVADHTTWIVGAGENLWSIAAAHLGEALGRRPSPSEVTPYWQAVIAINRSALPDPSNPDLLYRGIALAMPPVAANSTR
jgi:hypothetical protein